MSLEEISIWTLVKSELLDLYLLEERNLIQKCKLLCLKAGDENTNFFHRFLAAKKRKSLISELSTSDGMIIYLPRPSNE